MEYPENTINLTCWDHFLDQFHEFFTVHNNHKDNYNIWSRVLPGSTRWSSP